MSSLEREEAVQENMTLTVESARAIGCQVTDSTGDLIIARDPPTIRSFIVDLIRVSCVMVTIWIAMVMMYDPTGTCSQHARNG